MRRRRIVHVITHLESAGAQGVLLRLIEPTSSDFEHAIVSLRKGGSLLPAFQAADVHVTEADLSATFPSPLKLTRMARMLREAAPALVQTWLYHSDLVGGCLARAVRGPAVAWNLRHSDLDPTTLRPSTIRIARLNARLSSFVPDQIICCSRSSQEHHRQIGYDSERMTVIENGFDTEEFRPRGDARVDVRRELGLPESTPLVGYVARVAPQKDHSTLLRAMNHVPDSHLLLVGEGTEVNNDVLSVLIATQGLQARVHRLGVRKDIPRLLAALDVAVLASASGEGFPNVLGEAMAAGVPCVSTDTGDARRIVGPTGIVVPPRDPHLMGDAIRNLLGRHDRETLGASARQRILRRFSVERMVEEYRQTWSDLITDHPG